MWTLEIVMSLLISFKKSFKKESIVDFDFARNTSEFCAQHQIIIKDIVDVILIA